MKINFTPVRILLSYFLFTLINSNAFAQPANDNCGGALGTTMNPNGSCAATTSVVTTGATISSPTIVSGTFCANSSGNDDVWYTFTTTATQQSVVFIFSNLVATTGTTTSGVGLAVYSGPCTGLTQLYCTASGIAANGTTQTSITGLSPNTTYFIRTWTGGPGNAGTYGMCVQEGPPPPNCATGLSPANGSTPTLLCSPNPSSIVFSWTAPSSGPAPTSYKVYLGTGTPALLGSVAGTSATVFNLLPNTTYNWYVVPSNGSDAVGCNTPITFTTGPEPACVSNNSCASAAVIGGPGSAGTLNSTTTGATISMTGELCNGFTGNADDDVWFSFTTDADGGTATIALTNAASTLDAVIQAYSGSCGTLVNIGCSDVGTSGGQNETLILNGLAGNTTYYVRVYGFGAFSATTPTSGTFTITTSGTAFGVVATTLTTLTAKLQKEDALLNWHIAQESDNKGFEVLKSYDGSNFMPIGFVKSKGNTAMGADYSFTDPQIRGGIKTFYRLRQVDNDGQSKLTGIVSVKLNKVMSSMAFVYPNPTKDLLNLTFNDPLLSETAINITDATGRLLLRSSAPKGTVTLQLNISAFRSGHYVIRLTNEQTTEQLPFIKIQ